MGLFSPLNQVGLYIDTETICVVNSKRSGQTTQIVGFSELKVQSVLFGPPELKQKVVDSICLALERAKVTIKTLSLAIPGDGSMTRHFKLPTLPKKEERNAVRFEAQKYVPFDMKDLYFDYEIYPDLERKRSTIVFFACKKQWVDALTSLLQVAGTKISRVELVSQSLARAFYRQTSKSAEEVCAILSANSEQTAELVIQKKGSVLTTQHLALSELSPESQFIINIPSIVSDIRISMDYFNENFKTLKISRFYLVTPFPGDVPAFAQVLKNEFSVPVDSGKISQAPTALTCASASAAAYGLTLSAVDRNLSRKIDLKGADASTLAPVAALSWAEEKKQLQGMAVSEIIGIAVLTVVVYLFLSGLVNMKRMDLQKKTVNYPQSESASLSEPIETLQNKDAQARQKIAFYSKLFDKRVYFTLKLNALAKLIPVNVQLQQLNYVDDVSSEGSSAISLRLTGLVLGGIQSESELTVLNKLVATLRENQDFMAGMNGIRIVSTQRTLIESQPAMRFSLDCTSKKA